jgi:hypothetical protein
LDRFVPAFGTAVIQSNELSLTPLAEEHEALVLDDPQQPRGEFGFSLELIDVLECLPACILCLFLRFASVSKDGSGEVDTSAAMTANQLVKRFSIAMLCQRDEL